MPMHTALLAHSSKSTTTFTDTSWSGLAWLRRAYRQDLASGFVGADYPHGEELGATTVGLAEGAAGVGHLVLPGHAPHLQGSLEEAQHARGANGVGRQDATRAVPRDVATLDHGRRPCPGELPAVALGAEAEVLEPH